MKLSYVATVRLPTEKAHGYQIMRVCSELSRLGHEVVLYVPKRGNVINQDPFAYYTVEANFKIERARCFDAMRFVAFLGPLAFWLTTRSFLRSLRLPKDAVVYTRDADAVAYLSARGYRCVYNAHNWAPSRARRIRAAVGVVCNSEGTAEAVKAATELPTLVAHNASDPNPFVGSPKLQLRRELGLPTGDIALYTGHLYGWKGSRVLLACARLLPNVHFVVVGGTVDDIARLRSSCPPNLVLLGHKPKADIPKYTAAADVLLLPNTDDTEESARFTSPLKMFEYMASGVPIVASDLPSLREVLSSRTALLVPPGDAATLAYAISQTLSDTENANARARAALEESQAYSWAEHAKCVARFMESL